MNVNKRNNKHNNSSNKQRLWSFFAVLLLITLPIAQLNLMALTGNSSAGEKLDKLHKSSINELLKKDASMLGNGTQETSPLPTLEKAETKEETEEGSKKEEEERKEEETKKNNSDDKNADNTSRNNSTSNEKSSSNNSSNSNKSSNKSNESSSSSKKDDSSSKDSGSSKKEDSSNSTDDEKPKSGHWEQKLVKEAWSETVTVTKYRCMCGAIFDSPAAWQAHRPNP